MTRACETPQKTQGSRRDLLLVWQRELDQKLWINQYLPGCSREATLEIMTEMDRDR